MSYLKYLDCETVDSTNKVSRFSHENQSEVNQGVTHSTFSNDNTTLDTYFVSNAVKHGLLLCEYF